MKAWKKNEETHSVDLEIPNLSNGVLNGEDWDNVREKIIDSKKRRKKATEQLMTQDSKCQA